MTLIIENSVIWNLMSFAIVILTKRVYSDKDKLLEANLKVGDIWTNR